MKRNKAKTGPKPMPEHLLRVDPHTRIQQWILDEVDTRKGGRGPIFDEALIIFLDLKKQAEIYRKARLGEG